MNTNLNEFIAKDKKAMKIYNDLVTQMLKDVSPANRMIAYKDSLKVTEALNRGDKEFVISRDHFIDLNRSHQSVKDYFIIKLIEKIMENE